MIIQQVLKGIGGISRNDAQLILNQGIICNWWRKIKTLPSIEIPLRLTERNLDWHQNRYSDPDPSEGNEPFGMHSPFISVTAGTTERDVAWARNFLHPAWEVALEFATDGWQRDGFVFHCYVFILGRKSIPHIAFSEEVRELNIYTGFSVFQPEGEITAKITIPPAQIEKYDFYDIDQFHSDLDSGRLPLATNTVTNNLYQPPDEISNIRGFLV